MPSLFPHDSFELLVTLNGSTCVTVATVTPEDRFAADSDDACTDEAVIGFAALSALGLIVDCKDRCVRPRCE